MYAYTQQALLVLQQDSSNTSACINFETLKLYVVLKSQIMS